MVGCDSGTTEGLCLEHWDPVPGLRVQNAIPDMIHWPGVVFGE